MKVYAGEPIARRCKVFLDDADVSRDCTYADDENGVVTLFVRDAQGRHVINRDASGRSGVARTDKHGRVRIEIEPEPQSTHEPD